MLPLTSDPLHMLSLILAFSLLSTDLIPFLLRVQFPEKLYPIVVKSVGIGVRLPGFKSIYTLGKLLHLTLPQFLSLFLFRMIGIINYSCCYYFTTYFLREASSVKSFLCSHGYRELPRAHATILIVLLSMPTWLIGLLCWTPSPKSAPIFGCYLCVVSSPSPCLG